MKKVSKWLSAAAVTLLTVIMSAVTAFAAEDDILVFEGEGKRLSVPFIEYGKENDGASQARKIFSALRRVDETGAKLVYARFPEKDGVGLAVLNRLIRAAAFNIIEL